MPFNLKEQKVDLLKPKGSQVLQLSLDENTNVPDIKPDIDKVLQTNALITITKEEIDQDQIIVGGELKANLLYVPLNDKKPIHSMDLIIPFEERLNVENMQPKDTFKVDYVIEDLSVHLLNSRKVNLKSICQLKVDISEKKEVYITSDVDTGTSEVEKLLGKVNLCQLKEATKCDYKIKDEFGLPSGKPNINEILWYDTTIQNKDVKLIDGKVNIKGTLHVAALYSAQDSDHHLEYVENDVTFNGLLDCPGSRENMIQDVGLKIVNDNVIIRLDVDGEERVIGVEVETAADIKVYDEQDVSILKDLYALNMDIGLKKEPVSYQKLLCKNQSQYNLKEPIVIDNEDSEILQIYYTGGNCTVETMKVEDEKILVEGTLFCKVMYVVADDKMPIHVFETMLPFDHHIDIKGITKSSQISLSPNVNYIGCTMIGDKEIELKCAIQMNTMVFDNASLEVIKEIEEKPIDIKTIQKIPGIVGYIVKERDTLWDIAKRYRTKVKNIMKTNGLDTDKINKGDQLIIVKELQF